MPFDDMVEKYRIESSDQPTPWVFAKTRCSGRMHEVGWYPRGRFILMDHSHDDIRALRTLQRLGDKTCGCLALVDEMRARLRCGDHRLNGIPKAFRPMLDAAKRANIARSQRGHYDSVFEQGRGWLRKWKRPARFAENVTGNRFAGGTARRVGDERHWQNVSEEVCDAIEDRANKLFSDTAGVGFTFTGTVVQVVKDRCAAFAALSAKPFVRSGSPHVSLSYYALLAPSWMRLWRLLGGGLLNIAGSRCLAVDSLREWYTDDRHYMRLRVAIPVEQKVSAPPGVPANIVDAYSVALALRDVVVWRDFPARHRGFPGCLERVPELYGWNVEGHEDKDDSA